MNYWKISMIEINNLTTNPVDEKFLKKVAKMVLEGEKKNDSELSIALVGQGRIRELNKKYRKKNRVTDVLAFPESKVLLEKFRVGRAQKIQGLGEIVICLREVKKNAKKFTPLEITETRKKRKENKSLTGFNSTFEKELARVLIHGILHLLGYDHEKSKIEAEEMGKKEEFYLSKLDKIGEGSGEPSGSPV